MVPPSVATSLPLYSPGCHCPHHPLAWASPHRHQHWHHRVTMATNVATRHHQHQHHGPLSHHRSTTVATSSSLALLPRHNPPIITHHPSTCHHVVTHNHQPITYDHHRKGCGVATTQSTLAITSPLVCFLFFVCFCTS